MHCHGASDGHHNDDKGQLYQAGSFASLIGTTIEWYDFFLYGTAAALVFNRCSFRPSTPA